MEKLNYDVAQEFIKTGTRINPKKHPCSWFFTSHRSGFSINGYDVCCHYDGYNNITTVHFRILKSKIPFEVSNAIYEKFKDENDNERPIFEYDHGKSLNPSIPVVTAEQVEQYEQAQRAIINQISHNIKVAYLFPEEIAEKIVGYFKGTIFASPNCASYPGFNMNTFINNMHKFEKRKDLSVDSFILYTMEELEFALELIRCTENKKIS